MLLVTVITGLILFTVMVVLSLVKTPHYRLGVEAVERFLVLVLTGQATENDWSVFTSVPIRHNEELERIRLACVALEDKYYLGQSRGGHLLTRTGLQMIEELLIQLRKTRDNS